MKDVGERVRNEKYKYLDAGVQLEAILACGRHEVISAAWTI